MATTLRLYESGRGLAAQVSLDLEEVLVRSAVVMNADGHVVGFRIQASALDGFGRAAGRSVSERVCS